MPTRDRVPATLVPVSSRVSYLPEFLCIALWAALLLCVRAGRVHFVRQAEGKSLAHLYVIVALGVVGGYAAGARLAVCAILSLPPAVALLALAHKRVDGLRPALLRTLMLSSLALAAVPFAAAVTYLAPYSVRRMLTPAAWIGCYVAAGNALFCLVRVLLARDRIVSLVALVICLLATAAAVLLAPFGP